SRSSRRRRSWAPGSKARMAGGAGRCARDPISTSARSPRSSAAAAIGKRPASASRPARRSPRVRRQSVTVQTPGPEPPRDGAWHDPRTRRREATSMDAAAFWQLIEDSRENAGGDPDEQADELADLLSD